VLYERLAEKLPQIEEYAQLWSAEATMPDMESLRVLKSVADYRPQSPAAYHAHIVLADYYASIEAEEAADEYRAALRLDDSVALRLELARHPSRNKGTTKELMLNTSTYWASSRMLSPGCDAPDMIRWPLLRT
jgi:hypothetical protein